MPLHRLTLILAGALCCVVLTIASVMARPLVDAQPVNMPLLAAALLLTYGLGLLIGWLLWKGHRR
jgi:type VI protein secretion system component VasK